MLTQNVIAIDAGIGKYTLWQYVCTRHVFRLDAVLPLNLNKLPVYSNMIIISANLVIGKQTLCAVFLYLTQYDFSIKSCLTPRGLTKIVFRIDAVFALNLKLPVYSNMIIISANLVPSCRKYIKYGDYSNW